jgi:hypothetical protein
MKNSLPYKISIISTFIQGRLKISVHLKFIGYQQLHKNTKNTKIPNANLRLAFSTLNSIAFNKGLALVFEMVHIIASVPMKK